MSEKLSLRSIWKAKQRIIGIAAQTRLIYSEALSKNTGDHVYLKLENEQPTGAFKLRGAANKILSLSLKEQQKGVATFSTGNHGIAVAYVAKQLGIHSIVCISSRVPNGKVNRLKQLGAEVIVVGDNQDDAEDYCYQLEREKGVSVIKPFDDLDIIAGQGTIGLEVMDQCPDIDEVIVPLSGGGLLSGVAYTLKAIEPSIRVTGVTMENAAVMHESLKQGYPVKMAESPTIADSLLGGIGPNNEHTFSLTQQYMDESLLLSEKAISEGVLFMIEHHKMVIEGAAGAGVGQLLLKKKGKERTIVVIVSGNNVDHETVRELLETR
ncbi:pyridoxal-phosphate dependent enzyme [Halobacillus amylolyticus]|uniref:Pyridoxal-phosphate dependent enzyme n=1 Tax=Halobacillus amylolyticus TaxID=2932259 RepID=A0ABY4H8P8_9BACI|nr:pyridoxal-phosphate dependent enzyme [Halobacillus amylolyticus]UOR10921.1 pyridoxal-phosphate dependent enzyme [Halobacillus amylolyticus]